MLYKWRFTCFAFLPKSSFFGNVIYFMHYLHVVIVLCSTGLLKLGFIKTGLLKPGFRLSLFWFFMFLFLWKSVIRNLRSIISFILELWYRHRTFIVETMHKLRTSFKRLASRKATTWWLKQSQNNDKLLLKVISSSYHIEQKTSK